MTITICKEEERGVNPALIIIPDISGFTRFISENQLLHAQKIIAELLEKILACLIENARSGSGFSLWALALAFPSLAIQL